MTLNTYVNFAGKCAEAFRYYEHHLGGRVLLRASRFFSSRREKSWTGEGAAQALGEIDTPMPI